MCMIAYYVLISDIIKWVKLDDLMLVKMLIVVFWSVMLSILVAAYQHLTDILVTTYKTT
jgi:hypothetical protein